MNLEPYQDDAAEFLSRHRRAVLVSPAGSGKTVIAASAVQRVVKRKPRTVPVKVGWMCNTIEQKEQALKALAEFPCGTDTRVECAAAGADWSDRDVLVIDECHHAPAWQWNKQVLSCNGARWAMTATPSWKDDPERAGVFHILFGASVHEVPREAVKSRLSPARVVMLEDTDPGLKPVIDAAIREATDEMMAKSWLLRKQLAPQAAARALAVSGREPGADPVKLAALCKVDYSDTLQDMVRDAVRKRVSFLQVMRHGIVPNKARNDAVVRSARFHLPGRQVLVLASQVEHCKALSARIPGSVVCNSKMPKKARAEAMSDFRNGKLRCIVATSLADEGLDLPSASVLVLAAGGRSRAKAEQRTGRVLRSYAGKSEGLIYDFFDRFHPLAERHAQARVQLYAELGYGGLTK